LKIAGNAKKHQLQRDYKHLLGLYFSIYWRDMYLLNANIMVRKDMEVVLVKNMSQTTIESHINVTSDVGSYSITVNVGDGHKLGFISIKPPPQGN
jgi:hypothetical protein